MPKTVDCEHCLYFGKLNSTEFRCSVDNNIYALIPQETKRPCGFFAEDEVDEDHVNCIECVFFEQLTYKTWTCLNESGSRYDAEITEIGGCSEFRPKTVFNRLDLRLMRLKKRIRNVNSSR